MLFKLGYGFAIALVLWLGFLLWFMSWHSGCPTRWTAMDVKEWGVDNLVKHNGEDVYRPARPVPFWGLCFFYRLKMAWLVFTGQCDVLDWEE